jgi:hypothetical protein
VVTLDAIRHFFIDPITKRSPALFLFRAAQILHERTRGHVDRPLMRILSKLRSPVALPSSIFVKQGEIERAVAALRARGWWLMPRRLDGRDIAEIRQFAFATPAFATRFDERIAIDEEQPPQNHSRYEWQMKDLLQLPAIQRLLRDSSLHRIAQGYIGCRPTLTSVTLWLDPVFDGPAPTRVYHYDNDGPGFLKFFIYLSDVDSETGAHTYIQGTHGHNKPEAFRRSRRYERDDLLRYYGADNEIIFAAPAGTILAEDTAGFHRGMDLKRGYRLLLQLQYSAIDIPHAEEFATTMRPVRLPGLADGIAAIARKFVSAA